MAGVRTKQRMTYELAETFDVRFFKTFSEPIRVKILQFLLLHGRSDIAAIAADLPQDRSVISRHLNLMHRSGILSSEKEGRNRFYAIDAGSCLDQLEAMANRFRACVACCCPELLASEDGG